MTSSDTAPDPAPDPPPALRTDPPRASTTLGRDGEDLAVRYLRDHGMEVVERNWRCEHGEVDVVAVDGDCLVICEVKTRRSLAFGEPVEAVTPAKAARLRRLAATYVRGRGTGSARVRIDVLGIVFRVGQPPVVRHVRGVGS
jgi:putative endonuclease